MKLVNHSCPSCNSNVMNSFYEVKNIPINSCLLFSNQREAVNYPKGDINLGLCSHCAFITNLDFDERKINYANLAPEEQSSSATFMAYARKLATRLIESYNIKEKNILEIGCGRGDFLSLLCDIGNNSGVGIDPSTITGELNPIPKNIKFIRDYFSKKYASYIKDLLCCRHTLEHISQTLDFSNLIRESIDENYENISFYEVPDTTRILNEVAFWDIYYEHCSYFTTGSLARLFRKAKFELTYLSKDYFDQYLLIDLKPLENKSHKIFPNEEEVNTTINNVLAFSQKSKIKISKWKDLLEKIRKQKKRAVVWGSGSKCVGFMTTLNVVNEIDFIIDINPLRHRKFIAGVGKEIKSPQFLEIYKPDVVIIMNPVYLNEIKRDLYSMNLHPEIIPCL